VNKDRLTAFSDGVIAIIITIMVLELRPPHEADWPALAALAPVFLSYVLSFVFVAIYWNNHHHLLAAAKGVDGAVMWANTNLLFWLSLIPFATGWMGENDFATLPVAVYGLALLAPSGAYWLLQAMIVRANGPDHPLGKALGRDLKGKASLLFCVAGSGLAFVDHWLGCTAYVLLALLWLVPDRRIERILVRA
jgi:uncharacterized membrane protein